MSNKTWIVKAFHTGGPYQKDADKLQVSAKKFDIPIDIEVIRSFGSWNQNTHYKPQSILNAMKKYPSKNIWHVDADSWFMRYPALFDMPIDYPIGAFYFGTWKTWCSGTVYFENSDVSKQVLLEWIDELAKDLKQRGDQVAMGRVFDRLENIIVGEIPAGYIQGLSPHLSKDEGVIAHDGARKRYVGTRIYTEPK